MRGQGTDCFVNGPARATAVVGRTRRREMRSRILVEKSLRLREEGLSTQMKGEGEIRPGHGSKTR